MPPYVIYVLLDDPVPAPHAPQVWVGTHRSYTRHFRADVAAMIFGDILVVHEGVMWRDGSAPCMETEEHGMAGAIPFSTEEKDVLGSGSSSPEPTARTRADKRAPNRLLAPIKAEMRALNRLRATTSVELWAVNRLRAMTKVEIRALPPPRVMIEVETRALNRMRARTRAETRAVNRLWARTRA